MKLVMTIVIYAFLLAATADAAFAQEKPQPAKAPEANTAKATAAEPTVDQILDRYVEATGGRQAVEKITSRVAKGTLEVRASKKILRGAPLSRRAVVVNVESLNSLCVG